MISTRSKVVAASMAVIMSILLVACSTLLTVLEAGANSINSLAGDPQLPANVQTWLGDAGAALDCAVTDIQKGGTNADIGFALGQCGAAAVLKVAPTGLTGEIATGVSLVLAALQAVVDQQQAASTAAISAPNVPFASSFGPHSGDKYNGAGHWFVKGKLAKIHKTLQAAKAKLPKK